MFEILKNSYGVDGATLVKSRILSKIEENLGDIAETKRDKE